MLVNPRVALTGLLVAVLASGATSAPVPLAVVKAEKELAAVKEKVCGSWHGDQCEGEYTFRPNGTYDFVLDGGPIPVSHGGVWNLRGDPAKPTLVMHCRKGARRETTIELAVVRVLDKEFEFADPDETPRTFYRAKPDKAPAERKDK